jgi:large subunit ribosomal protein L29
MKSDEIRALPIDEIRARLDEARENYFKLRFRIATGQLADTSQLRFARRDVARLATILREEETAAALEGSEA